MKFFFLLILFITTNVIFAQRVGIGSTQFTPSNTLDVKGNAAIGTNYTGIATAAPSNGLIIEGNVGISTHSPTYKLDVTGTTEWGIRYLKTGSRDARITVGDPTRSWSSAVGWNTAGDFSIIEEGVAGDRFYIRQGGNTGIGTSNPGARLTVQGGMILDNAGAQGASITAASSLIFGGASGEGIASARTAVANQFGIDFYTNSANRMSITNRGWVGIGTTRPGLATTEENSWLNVPAGFRFLTINGAAGAGGLEFTTNFADANLANIGIITFTDRNRTSAGGSTDNRAACITGYQQGSTANRRGGALGFFVLPDNSNSVVTNAMWIDNNAFVSFNHTNGSLYSSPRYQLSVYGAGQSTANMTDAGNKSAAILVSDANGFSAGNGGAILLGANSSATNASPWAAIKGIFTANGASAIGDLAFSMRTAVGDASLTESMRITSRGWVGIGTTRPGIGSANENPWVFVSSTRRFLTINGDGGGALELTTNEADGDQVGSGIIQWTDKNRTNDGSTENRLATITAGKSGTTANRRGGYMRFYVMPDNSNGNVSWVMGFDHQGYVGFNHRNGVQYTLAPYQMTIWGSGQNTANTSEAGSTAGAIFIADDNDGAGQGGAILLGGNRRASSPPEAYPWVSIKALRNAASTSGANRPIGDLAFSTRNAIGETSLTERMRLLANGNFGIGTTNPQLRLAVNGDIHVPIDRYTYYGDPGLALNNKAGYIGYSSTFDAFVLGALHQGVAWKNILITQQGQNSNVGVRTNTPGVTFEVGTNGDGTVGRANAWNTFSDVRWKKDISPITNGLEKVKGLQGVNYTWKSTDKKDFGFIAQEVEKVLPLAVHTDDQGYKSVDYARITAVLVEALKEQQKTIEELKQHNIKQDATINYLNSQLNSVRPITGNAK